MAGITQVVDGVVYYSPNSLQTQKLNLEDTYNVNPFKPGTSKQPRTLLNDILSPRRWSRPFGWLCCIPLCPRLRGFPFEGLSTQPIVQSVEDERHPPIMEDVKSHGDIELRGSLSESMINALPPAPPPIFQLDHQQAQLWRLLETQLFLSVTNLKGRHSLAMVLPFLPFGLGYYRKFKSYSLAEFWVRHSRKWFSVWLGALSYAIVRPSSGGMVDGMHSRFPEWQSALLEAGFDAVWIDGVMHSSVCEFSLHNPRVGCIIDLLNPDPSQPTVNWFIQRGIPVWYQWEHAEERFIRTLPRVPTLVYQPEVSQAPSQDAEMGSSMLPFNVASTAHKPQDQAVSLTKPNRSWTAHFNEREERRATAFLKETAVQKCMRTIRERNPPNSSLVFEWLPSQGDSGIFVRVPVRSASRADTLRMYGPKQKRYDALFDEWDCCTQFGEADESTSTLHDHVEPPVFVLPGENAYTIENAPKLDLRMDISSQSSAVASLVAQEAHNAVMLDGGVKDIHTPERISAQISSPLSQTTTSPLSALNSEVQEVFGLFYGFAMPLPTTDIPPPGMERHKDLFAQILGAGLVEPSNSYFDTTHYAAAQSFFELIRQRKAPVEGSWDISDSAVHPVKLSPRLSLLRHVHVTNRSREYIDSGRSDDVRCYYVFTFPDVVWKLAMLSAASALHVCRLPAGYDAEDIVLHLAQRAVPFRILSLPPKFSNAVIQPKTRRLVRPFNHKFTKRDYESYVNLRTNLLSEPHMQAALRRGGIIWRLSISVLGLNDISKPATQAHSYISANIDSHAWVDDSLTKDELDLICGVYECVSDDGRQRSTKSWWPQALLYEKAECGENYGRWGQRRELWYRERLKAIEEGTQEQNQPLTYTEWKSRQHGHRSIRTFHHEIETQSYHFLCGQL